MSAEPPSHLDGEASAIWRELAPRYSGDSDPLQLELLAVHTGLHRRLVQRLAASESTRAAGQTVDMGPLVVSLRQEAALCRNLAASLRLRDTPPADNSAHWLDTLCGELLPDARPAGH